ncbi:cytochrome P450 [Streptomyces sp. MBT70]|nr:MULTISPECIES: cytochrome P450 [Streptomyces]MBK3525738.1 cytochrome P450 [Streptomyces sp. MBT70]
MWDWLAPLVRQKRARPDDGLISAMVAANDEGDHLTEPELLANLEGLLIAGHETTVNQLGNSFLTLLRHPDQLALLRSALDLVGPAIDELLRYSRLFTSAEVRVTTEPVELDGVGLGAGQPCCRSSSRPTATRVCTRIPTASTSPAKDRRPTSPSGTGRTSASARYWPAGRCGWRSGPW